MSAPKRRATYDDLRKVPDRMVAEIIDGELFTTPRPASPHALAASMLAASLIEAFARDPGGAGVLGGWWILFEPELHFGDDVVVPDLAGWRRERMPAVPDVPFFDLVPDWICEVISRSRKMRVYAREGAGHLWIVDPILRTLEVYRQEGSRWVVASTHAGTEAVRAEPFEALTLDLGRWWLAPRATLP